MKKKKKSKVSIEVSKPELANVDSAPDTSLIEKALSKCSEEVKAKSPAMVISRLDHPTYIMYEDSEMLVSPRAKLKIPDIGLLGDLKKLPSGILVKKLK